MTTTAEPTSRLRRPSQTAPHGRRPTGGPPNRFRPLGRLAALLVAAGLVAAIVAAPFVVGTGLAVKSTADHFDALPTDLPDPSLGRDSRILAADGSVLAVLHGPENRVPVTIDQVPQVLRQAVVDVEDSRFYTHHGIDLHGLARAAANDTSTGGVQQGGSTITEQYVKNVLLNVADTPAQREAATGKSLARKLREARYAIALERRWSKDQILQGYLNIVYFGNGAYGIGAAAQRYFGKSVSDLTLPEAALLAGLVQSPSAYDPLHHPQEALHRRAEVLGRMRELHHLSPQEEAAANAAPLDLNPTLPPPTADPCLDSSAPFFCDYVRSTLRRDPALGSTQAERDNRLLEGGLTIRTTLDPTVQQAAQRAVDNTVEPSNRVAATEVVVQPGTGNVLAMAVNRKYGTDPGETTLPLPTTAAFQPGSTFKVFTLVAALQRGLSPRSTTFYAPACYVSKIYPIGADSGRQSGGGCPNGFSNADPAEAGTYNMVNATWQSVNTYYIQLEEKVGIPAVVQAAEELGIPSQRLARVGPTSGSLTIGSFEVSPLDMATAYATLAAHGLHCDPRAVASATGPDGLTASITPAAPCTQVLDQDVADTATSILEGVITHGTGYPNAAGIGRPAAGKTGTTEGHSSAWFVGYTPQLSAAVAVGDPTGPTGHPLTNVSTIAGYWGQVFGGDIPAMIWARSMSSALVGDPVESMPTPAYG